MPTTAQKVVVAGADIGKQVNDSLGEVRTALASVTDVSSARKILPRLQAATVQIDKAGSVVERLPPDQRQYVSGLVAAGAATINPLFDKVLAIPGVGEVLKPTADNLRIKLADISEHSPTVGFGR